MSYFQDLSTPSLSADRMNVSAFCVNVFTIPTGDSCSVQVKTEFTKMCFLAKELNKIKNEKTLFINYIAVHINSTSKY